jgi:hypothetical protein
MARKTKMTQQGVQGVLPSTFDPLQTAKTIASNAKLLQVWYKQQLKQGKQLQPFINYLPNVSTVELPLPDGRKLAPQTLRVVMQLSIDSDAELNSSIEDGLIIPGVNDGSNTPTPSPSPSSDTTGGSK